MLMVGYGVNDAPALSAATCGIAMDASGSDAVIEAADIAMLSDDLRRVVFAIGISRLALQVTPQNIVLSIDVLAANIPSALAGLTGITTAVLVHVAAELLALLNGLRAGQVRGGDVHRPDKGEGMTALKNDREHGEGDPWSTRVLAVVILEPDLRSVARELAHGEIRSAVEQCTAYACSGKPHAQAALAALWLFAARDPRRIAHATSWARRAHDAGRSHGTDVLEFVALAQENRKPARHRIQEAANRTCSPAMLTLGRFEPDGVGGPIDVAAGLAHLRSAVGRGHRLAAITLWAFQARRSRTGVERLWAQWR